MTAQRLMLVILGLGLLICGLVLFAGDPESPSLAQPAGPGAATPGATAQPDVEALPATAATTTQRVAESQGLGAGALLQLEQAPRGEDTFGTLFLTVRGFEDDEPLPGIRLTVETSKGRRLARMRMFKPGPGANLGTPDDALLSDLHGLATFTVPANQGLTVRAWGEDGGAQPLEKGVVKLGNLEERRVTLRLRTRLDVGLRGRVVSAEGNGPIAGALVAVRSGASSMRSSKTDDEGYYWSWAQSGTGVYLRIDCEGFTPAMIPASPSPPRGEATEVVVLRRSGGIEFNVIDSASLAVAQVDCVVTAAPLDLSRGLSEPQVQQETFYFNGRTNRDGMIQLDGLPSGVPLQVEFRPFDGGMHPLVEPIVLEPGQIVRCDFELPGPLELRGTLTNQDGEPIAGQPMWAVPSHDTRRRVLNCSDCDSRVAGRDGAKGRLLQGITLANGRFLFEDIAEGTYLVGPVPTCVSEAIIRGCEITDNTHDVAPIGTPIRLVGGSAKHLDLVLAQGLYVEGRVVDVDGNGVRGSVVNIRQAGLMGSEDTCETRGAGKFSFGPLDAGPYSVVAMKSSTRSLIVRVEPKLIAEGESKDEEVLLVLREASEEIYAGKDSSERETPGSITGLLVTDSSRRLPGLSGLFLQPRGGSGSNSGPQQGSFDKDTGEFRFQGLMPGTYVLTARNFERVRGSRRNYTLGQSGKAIATMTVTLPPGGVDLEGVQFYVGPVAQLNLRVSEGTAAEQRGAKGGARSRWSYTLRSGADLVLRGVFWGTESGAIAVPPGFLEVVITEMDTDHAILGRGEAVLAKPLELVF